MRSSALFVALVVGLVPGTGIGRADGERLRWPLAPTGQPVVSRPFDAPSPDWQRGHRGVDLTGRPGQPVSAAGAGTVVFAGLLAGRPVVSIAHPGGLRTSYEPVEAAVSPGQSVAAGTPLGRLLPGHPGCAGAACLHWGAMWGPAARADYVDPLGLLAGTPVRLKPVGGQARGWAWSWTARSRATVTWV